MITPQSCPEAWAEFFEQVRSVRKLQKLYRRTMAPNFRRECEKQEDVLDAMIRNIGDEALAAAEPIAESLPVEGGVA